MKYAFNQFVSESARKLARIIQPHALEFGITVAALLAVLFHIVFPNIPVDNITLAFAVLAVLPWLPRLMSKITLPGGIKIDFRDIQKIRENVQTLNARVDQLTDWVIQGVGKEQRDKLSAHLEKLRNYLMPFAGVLVKPPQIYIEGSDMASCYIPASHEIIIQREFAQDLDVVSREYMHSVLLKSPRSSIASFQVQGLESGLADYFVGSEKGESLLYSGTRLREIQLANDRKFEAGFDTEDAGNDLGEIWGGAFWKVRTLMGKAAADTVLWNAWDSANLDAKRDEKQLRADFAEHVKTEVEKQSSHEKALEVARIFAASGAKT